MCALDSSSPRPEQEHDEQCQIASFLVRNGADPNFKNEGTIDPLALAIQEGYVAIAQKLIECGANYENLNENLKRKLKSDADFLTDY